MWMAGTSDSGIPHSGTSCAWAGEYLPLRTEDILLIRIQMQVSDLDEPLV